MSQLLKPTSFKITYAFKFYRNFTALIEPSKRRSSLDKRGKKLQAHIREIERARKAPVLIWGQLERLQLSIALSGTFQSYCYSNVFLYCFLDPQILRIGFCLVVRGKWDLMIYENKSKELHELIIKEIGARYILNGKAALSTVQKDMIDYGSSGIYSRIMFKTMGDWNNKCWKYINNDFENDTKKISTINSIKDREYKVKGVLRVEIQKISHVYMLICFFTVMVNKDGYIDICFLVILANIQSMS
ncbi:hypothetical protein BY458DRAFT_551711 [Sporodiniella umbellata]|nr:hypothetical protein BY458DRAFT_551711 [Sporodiniella umbellata]